MVCQQLRVQESCKLSEVLKHRTSPVKWIIVVKVITKAIIAGEDVPLVLSPIRTAVCLLNRKGSGPALRGVRAITSWPRLHAFSFALWPILNKLEKF